MTITRRTFKCTLKKKIKKQTKASGAWDSNGSPEEQEAQIRQRGEGSEESEDEICLEKKKKKKWWKQEKGKPWELERMCLEEMETQCLWTLCWFGGRERIVNMRGRQIPRTIKYLGE